jgi:hypothetical protein
MKRLISAFREERGAALPLALITLGALSAMAVGHLALSTLEPQISRNLTDGSRARWVAEAGIEFGHTVLAANSGNWNPLLAGGGVLATNTPIPGSTEPGTFTVTIRNDTLAPGDPANPLGDAAITGVPVDPGSDTDDRNDVVIMTAVGTIPGTDASRTITVVVSRTPLPTISAALAFPGTEADVTFNGASFEIWGTDSNLDGSAGAGPAVYGITVSPTYPADDPGANVHDVEGELSDRADQVKGRDERDETDPSTVATGANTITADPAMTPEAVQTFVDALKGRADVVLESTPTAPLSFNSIGATCGSDLGSNTCWGTTTNPKIVYVKGSVPDPTSMFQALNVAGNSTGAGILIVEDGDMIVRGNFRWDGLVIVTGRYVGLGFLGGGSEQAFGAMIVNEMATDERAGFNEGVVTGNAKIRYSREAINLTQNMGKLVVLRSWREG